MARTVAKSPRGGVAAIYGHPISVGPRRWRDCIALLRRQLRMIPAPQWNPVPLPPRAAARSAQRRGRKIGVNESCPCGAADASQ